MSAAKSSANENPSPKRAHLMECAWRLFYRDGLRAVGIDTILAEAGVAKMTLYNHFPSKEDLIIAILEKRDLEIQTSLRAAVEAAGRSPTRRLFAPFDWLKTWFDSRDFNGCVFIRALSEYPDHTHPIHRTAWKHKLAVIKMLTALAAETKASDPAALAESFSLLINGAIVAAHATDTSAPADAARVSAQLLFKQAVG